MFYVCHAGSDQCCSPRVQDKTDDRVPRFFTKEGKTYSGTKSKVTEFADFSLKIIGELREGPKEEIFIRNKEGRWLVSLTGYVFSKQLTRYVGVFNRHCHHF